MKTTGIYRRWGKRACDIGAAALGLILLSPLLGLLALAVRIFLGPGVLFTQLRSGRHGKPFRIYKFRTMTWDRDDRGNLLPDAQRLPPFGRFLRQWSLDELPELFNVLRGEMSLVGPRPLVTAHYPLYTPEQARRLELRPGITGWAQVRGRNRLSWAEKFACDVWYVDHCSPLTDLKILALTPGTVLSGQGATSPAPPQTGLSAEPGAVRESPGRTPRHVPITF